MAHAVNDQDLLANVEALCLLANEHMIAALPELVLDDARDAPLILASTAAVHRQISALRGAVVLTQDGLGHLTLPLLRTACEERIWLAYLHSLSDDAGDTLVSSMVRLEASRIVGAQQQYFGKKKMKRLGFPKQFVDAQAANRDEAKQNLARLGKSLGWQAEPGDLPSTGWLASKVGLSQLYDFVYSATSKGVHFSPSELFRSGWTASEPNTPVQFLANAYTTYRAEFGLYWLGVLLLETLVDLIEHGPLGERLPDDPDVSAKFGLLASAIRAGGPVPIALASEFNLRAGP